MIPNERCLQCTLRAIFIVHEGDRIRIDLIAVDGHGGFPNLALMRLSIWHKRQGDVVKWWTGFTHYDKICMSKVFTFSPDFNTVIDADEIGTGYRDFGSLPPRWRLAL